MTQPAVRPPRHLHVFGLSLTLIVVALVGFLFGVRMEAIAPANGLAMPPNGSQLTEGEWPPIHLEFDEKNFGSVAEGQEVRLYSNMYPHRVHGIAKGVLSRFDPVGEAGPNGSRKFHAWVKLTECPFRVLVGSSFKAEVVTGRKPTYQIILEH